jgi:hypothetical protein
MLICERPFRIRETIAMSPAAFGSGEESWNA